jgi:hypothetical protein
MRGVLPINNLESYECQNESGEKEKADFHCRFVGAW